MGINVVVLRGRRGCCSSKAGLMPPNQSCTTSGLGIPPTRGYVASRRARSSHLSWHLLMVSYGN